MNSRSNNKLGDGESHLEETKTLQRKENVKKKKSSKIRAKGRYCVHETRSGYSQNKEQKPTKRSIGKEKIR